MIGFGLITNYKNLLSRTSQTLDSFLFFESTNTEHRKEQIQWGEPQKDSSQPRHTTKQEQKQLPLSKSKTNTKGNREKETNCQKKTQAHPAPCR